MEFMEHLLSQIVSWSILLFEFIGVGILIWTGLKGFRCYIKGNPETKLILAKGMATGLEFKLGSEILRTVVGYPDPVGDQPGGEKGAAGR